MSNKRTLIGDNQSICTEQCQGGDCNSQACQDCLIGEHSISMCDFFELVYLFLNSLNTSPPTSLQLPLPCPNGMNLATTVPAPMWMSLNDIINQKIEQFFLNNPGSDCSNSAVFLLPNLNPSLQYADINSMITVDVHTIDNSSPSTTAHQLSIALFQGLYKYFPNFYCNFYIAQSKDEAIAPLVAFYISDAPYSPNGGYNIVYFSNLSGLYP